MQYDAPATSRQGIDPRHDPALDAWFGGDLGAALLAREQALVARKLPELFGFHLMQLGVSEHSPLYANSMIRHCFQLGRSVAGSQLTAVTTAEQLPLESDSIDVAILHHALDFSLQPHQCLREAARAVVPHGHLLIVGFNPWSLFGLRALLTRRVAHPVWSARLLGAGRVVDWLSLLDFAVESVEFAFHAPPVQGSTLLHRLAPANALAERWRLPCGAIYLIHARKQVSPLTPSRPLLARHRPRLVGLPLAAPSARDTTIH